MDNSAEVYQDTPYIMDAEIPGPVHWYNHSMGGVDLNSQLRSYYPSGRSGKKWWRFIFWYTLDVSICNTFIIEGLSSHAPSARSRTHLQFRLELAKQLIGRFCGSIPVKRERLHPLTMPSPSQTYQVIMRWSWKDARVHAWVAHPMAEETQQDALRRLCMAVTAAVSICVVVADSLSTI